MSYKWQSGVYATYMDKKVFVNGRTEDDSKAVVSYTGLLAAGGCPFAVYDVSLSPARLTVREVMDRWSEEGVAIDAQLPCDLHDVDCGDSDCEDCGEAWDYAVTKAFLQDLAEAVPNED